MGIIKGTPYPVLKHPKGYLHSESDEIDQIKSDMLVVLLTRPGERVCEPQIGLDLEKIDRRQPLSAMVQQARHKIAAVLKNQERRIQVTDVRVEVEGNSIISYEVFFTSFTDLQRVESLTVSII